MSGCDRGQESRRTRLGCVLESGLAASGHSTAHHEHQIMRLNESSGQKVSNIRQYNVIIRHESAIRTTMRTEYEVLNPNIKSVP